MLALDRFFNEPTEQVLKDLFDAINGIDLSLMPLLSTSEKRILRASDDSSIFEHKFFPETPPNFASPSPASAVSRLSFPNDPKGRKDRRFYETNVVFYTIAIPIRITLSAYPEEIGDVSVLTPALIISTRQFSLINLITTFTSATATIQPAASSLKRDRNLAYAWHPDLDFGPNTPSLVLLLNALLTEKCIVFLGYGVPSGQVSSPHTAFP